MKKIIIVLSLIMLSACSQTQSLQKIVEKAEFKDGQEGCILITSNVGMLIITSKAALVYRKNTGENAPECEFE